jgi:hypothetical protein
MARRRKLKKAVTLPSVKGPETHDRRAIDVTRGARIATMDIKGPYWKEGDKLETVARNLRNDPLAGMHNSGYIDQAQYLAGRHWQRCWELSQGRSAQSCDFTRDAVDGGQIAQSTVTDTQIKASKQLDKAADALGLDAVLVHDVLAEKISIERCAVLRGLTSDWGRKAMGKKFRECLDTLAVVFNYARNKDHKAGEPQPDYE